MSDDQVKLQLHAAFVEAIQNIGLKNFKKCSFFGSQDQERQMKIARTVIKLAKR